MLIRIAQCSVKWQYLLQLKSRSNVGNGDSLNHHPLNSNVHGFIIMVVCRCLFHEKKLSRRRLL